MKCVCKSRSSRPKDKIHLRRELKALTELPKSPFLMRSHLAFESSSAVFFVTDLIGGGDLFFHLDFVSIAGHDGFAEPIARVLLAETAAGLCHMHDQNVIHRDIKVENVMLSSDGHVKLVDYGLCCEMVDTKEGTPVLPKLSPMS
jgi:serine/threonine protein kinase